MSGCGLRYSRLIRARPKQSEKIQYITPNHDKYVTPVINYRQTAVALSLKYMSLQFR